MSLAFRRFLAVVVGVLPGVEAESCFAAEVGMGGKVATVTSTISFESESISEERVGGGGLHSEESESSSSFDEAVSDPLLAFLLNGLLRRFFGRGDFFTLDDCDAESEGGPTSSELPISILIRASLLVESTEGGALAADDLRFGLRRLEGDVDSIREAFCLPSDTEFSSRAPPTDSDEMDSELEFVCELPLLFVLPDALDVRPKTLNEAAKCTFLVPFFAMIVIIGIIKLSEMARILVAHGSGVRPSKRIITVNSSCTCVIMNLVTTNAAVLLLPDF